MHWDYLSQGGHEHWGDLSKGGVVQGRIKVISANVGFNPDPIVAKQLRCLTKIGPTRNQIPSGSIG